ncbi:hypothetical protein AB0F17_62935 [Nonomuraea sp. NPDC026600]|uniref:hypothetical protein n=1 Tax=Nonomuraea sp. NPDC026600 TaxID=3155363 RepID=UPI0033C3B64C
MLIEYADFTCKYCAAFAQQPHRQATHPGRARAVRPPPPRSCPAPRTRSAAPGPSSRQSPTWRWPGRAGPSSRTGSRAREPSRCARLPAPR